MSVATAARPHTPRRAQPSVLFTPPAGRSGDEQAADAAGDDPTRQPAALADA